MEVVDVLRHDARCFASTIEARQCEMTAAWPCLAEVFLHREATSPGFIAHLLARQKLVERDRPVLGPDPTGRAKIRNAAFGRDSRAGKRYDDLRRIDELTQPCNACLNVGSNHI